MGPEEDLTGVHVDDEAENELQQTLNKARKLKQATTVQPDKEVLKRVGSYSILFLSIKLSSDISCGCWFRHV